MITLFDVVPGSKDWCPNWGENIDIILIDKHCSLERGRGPVYIAVLTVRI